jgi:uncharacterized repeat protein (TIGR03803 family)
MRKRNAISLYLLVAILALANAFAAQAQTYTYSILYNFQNNGTDPATPSSLITDPEGNLYGTSTFGGSHGFGAVFELSAEGTLSVLHNFAASDPVPNSLAWDERQGNLYGTTSGGPGTVFELVKGNGGIYTLSTLYSNSRSLPQSVTLDPNGNLWGTDDGRCLCVFEIPAGGQWTERLNTVGQPVEPQGNVLVTPTGAVYASIDNFGILANGFVTQINGTDEFFPPIFYYGPNSLAVDSTGNIYALAYGLDGEPGGMVLKTDPPHWRGTAIYTFTGGIDGTQPSGPFAIDSANNIYGTATGGKGQNGVVFKVTASGEASVLHDFSDGFNHLGLVMDGAGNLYGISTGAGAANMGYVWKLTKEN